jgi:pimeloyl-ACP methyl ester carboxylesterase
MPTLSNAKPVYVLVHGAFHGGWCWRRVADRLETAGMRVFTPTLSGLGERAHLLGPNIGFSTLVNDIAGVIETEELDHVILVGHSFGGAVITGVADRIPERLRQLVYLDAIVPLPGQSAIDQLPREIAELRIKLAHESSGGLSIPIPTGDIFDLPAGADRDWIARRITPHPLATYTDLIFLNGQVGNGLPCSYIRCTDPVYAAVQPSYERIKSESRWTLLDITAGHDAMVTAPGPLAELLLRLAQP